MNNREPRTKPCGTLNYNTKVKFYEPATHHMRSHSYLLPDRDDIPAFTPAEAGIQLSDPGGMQGWVDLVGLLHTEMVYPPEDSHPSKY